MLSATASFALPNCPSDQTKRYHNCFGTYTSADGEKYVGEWKDDKQHGQGTETFVGGGKYVGEYKDGNQNGQGSETFADGEKYVGGYKDGEKDGQGTLSWPDGEKYVGEYKDGKRNGQGTYTFADGTVEEGIWKDDEFQYAQAPACKGSYSTKWTSCIGTYTVENEAKYVGEFINGDFNGHGTMTWLDGANYIGEWRDDKRNGQGTYTYADGNKYVGDFLNGDFNGQGTLTSADGTVETGIWKDDILQPPEGLFRVVGTKLYFDTENTIGVDIINFSHTENLFDVLKSNDQIQTLVLNSTGGMTIAAREMADLVIDAGLDTHVEENCLSACVTIFLGGNNRSLALGGKIGFHKGHWEAASMREYYEDNKIDEEWANPFEFASWIYEDTQSGVFEEFEYLLERGVQASFAIKTLKADADGMWEPRRSVLRAGGILTQ